MAKLNTYLNFSGNTEEVFNFYKSVFGSEFSSLVRFKDMPMEGVEIAEDDKNKIMHISLPIGNDNVLMASDTLEPFGQKLTIGNNVYLSVHPESKEEADRIFKSLSENGKIEMDISDQPWGDYWGCFTDKFGIQWMVNYTYPQRK